MSDADAYRKESRARWGEQAKGWSARAEELGRVTMPVSVWMVDALELQPGHEILELAAGTGEVGFLAAEQIAPTGTLISSDFAPEMITAAQKRAEQLGITNVRFRQIDAESIDQEAASLDGVLCRWGYMLMADGEAALRETRRVLRPGARVALAVWAPPAENPWASIPGSELVERGHLERPDPDAPGQFAWARPGTIEEYLDAAGFGEHVVETLDFAQVFPSVDAWIAAQRDFASRFRAALDGLPAAERDDAIAAIRERALPYVQEDGSIVLPARTLGGRGERLADLAPQPVGGLAVAREERLDRELLDGDVDRRAERRDGAEEAQLAAGDAQPQRDDDVARGARRLWLLGRGVGVELRVERPQRRVAGDGGLAREPLQQVRLPLAEVGDPRGEPVRVQARAQDVGRRGEQVLGQPAHHQPGRPVVGDERPAAVDRQRRVGVVAVEHELDRVLDRLHLWLVERALLVDRRIAGGEQEPVALAQRDLELAGEVEDHLLARLRAAGLDEAEVAGGDARLEREVELAEAAALAPVAEEVADGSGGHAVTVRHRARHRHYLGGHGSASPRPAP